MTRPAPIGSGSTKIKVAAGYFLVVAVVFLLAYITYLNFHKIADSVDSLGGSRNESTLVRRIATGINEIRTSSTLYSITFDPDDYRTFEQGKASVESMIDSLDVQLAETVRYGSADTLKSTFRDYMKSIGNWHMLKKASRSDDLKKIAELIRDHGDSLTRSVENVPRTTTVTVRELTDEPVRTDTTVAEASGRKDNQKSFFRKLFGERKRNQETQTRSGTIDRKTITETYTRLDTAYYHQVDQILSQIRDTVTSTENTRKIREAQMARLEMILLDYQGELISRINGLLRHIESGERELLDQKIQASRKTAIDASKILVYAELAILIISLVFMFVIFTDLTRSNYYKQMLEAEKAETERLSKAKEEFLAMMSHEIRTPLNNIIGFSEQLQQTSLAPGQHNQVHSIVDSSRHLLALVNDILDYSKIESASLNFENIGFDIDEVVAEVMENLRFEAGKKKLQLMYDPPGEPALLSGDPFRLKQILINLTSNAIKFTAAGNVKISAVLHREREGYLLKCQVSDTGIGIEKDKLESIFHGFAQADSSITRRFGGTGLGLSICKKLVEMQKGTIRVESTPGQGSVFSFGIPYRSASHNDYSTRNRPYPGNGEMLKNRKLLVIDDDTMIQSLLEPAFGSWQATADFCGDPRKAWELLQQNPYDLILLDVNLSGADGYELLKQIRTDRQSRNKQTGIIICTALAGANPGEETGLPGKYPVLLKPFSRSDLWNSLCLTLEAVESGQPGISEGLRQETAGDYSLRSFRVYANEDPETLVLFIKTFISQTQNELAEMHRHSRGKNYPQVKEIAHKLKNTFGQLEARGLLAQLESLEALATEKNADPQKIGEQVCHLTLACRDLFSMLEKEVRSVNIRD